MITGIVNFQHEPTVSLPLQTVTGPRNILVEAAETDSLLGMSLLYGHEIRIRAVDGGLVTVERLPD